jgi:hypothetical protein
MAIISITIMIATATLIMHASFEIPVSTVEKDEALHPLQ